VDGTLAHAGRIAWDELLLIGALAIPFIIAVAYLVSKVMRSDR
jgi:flagellar biogenesis protein FliO